MENHSKGTKRTACKTNTLSIDNVENHNSLSILQATNETLRWCNQLPDPSAEEERIRLYKINRIKRYEAALKLPDGLIQY